VQSSSTLDVYTATRVYGSRTASAERYIIKKSGISVADWLPLVRSTQGCFVTILLGADHVLRCINILESVRYCWEISGVHYWWKRKDSNGIGRWGDWALYRKGPETPLAMCAQVNNQGSSSEWDTVHSLLGGCLLVDTSVIEEPLAVWACLYLLKTYGQLLGEIRHYV